MISRLSYASLSESTFPSSPFNQHPVRALGKRAVYIALEVVQSEYQLYHVSKPRRYLRLGFVGVIVAVGRLHDRGFEGFLNRCHRPADSQSRRDRFQHLKTLT